MHRVRFVRQVKVYCFAMIPLVCTACVPQTAPVAATEAPAIVTATPAPQVITVEVQPATPVPTLQPTPSPEPTPSPTPEPKYVTDMELDSGNYDGFYADTVFFGDSIMGSFSNYGASHKVDDQFLGGARILYKVGLSARLALKSKISFRGKEVYVTDAIKSIGAERIVIMLGVNDYAGKYHDATLEHFSNLIDALREKCPGTEIVIEALLPVTRAFCSENKINIANWNAFNPKLRELCEQKGVGFLDFSEYLKTDEGFLDKGLSRDNQFHLNTEGNDIYLRALRLYAMMRTETDAIYTGETPIDILLPADAPDEADGEKTADGATFSDLTDAQQQDAGADLIEAVSETEVRNG